MPLWLAHGLYRARPAAATNAKFIEKRCTPPPQFRLSCTSLTTVPTLARRGCSGKTWLYQLAGGTSAQEYSTVSRRSGGGWPFAPRGRQGDSCAKGTRKFQDRVVDLTLTLFCAWSHWKINGSSLAAADLLWGVGGCLAGELALAASPRPRWLSVQGLSGCHLLSLCSPRVRWLDGAWGPWIAVFGIPFRAGGPSKQLVGELPSYDHV